MRECNWRDLSLRQDDESFNSFLPYGNGRSYGDSCLNSEGILLDTRRMDRFIAFDPKLGVLRCETGVLFSEILDLVVPQGWFLPVTPGTQFVTVGGAVANDVHGKNHHRAGSFGCHVLRFELCRSDGTRLVCTPTENEDWFRATIGGLGLTGLITWVELRLRPICAPDIAVETIRFAHLDEFVELSAESDRDYEHTVAWVDCHAGGRSGGRGLFMRGNHVPCTTLNRPRRRHRSFAIPWELPVKLVNGVSTRLFNFFYYHRPVRQRAETIVHYEPFFYPLDSIGNWNRIYGPRGFMQYQCVIPTADGQEAISEMLARISRAGQGSFLAVLKVFGDIPSLGMMSFPRPGMSLALDFPNLGSSTLKLLDSLDDITREAGGAVYPAKDARMSPSDFRLYFPRWREFRRFLDPRCSSDFWRRMSIETP